MYTGHEASSASLILNRRRVNRVRMKTYLQVLQPFRFLGFQARWRVFPVGTAMVVKWVAGRREEGAGGSGIYTSRQMRRAGCIVGFRSVAAWLYWNHVQVSVARSVHWLEANGVTGRQE